MFSVIIPLYNKAPFIRRAIDSVLDQTFREFEIIVVNDGSTDGGEEIVKKVYGDKVILINQTNQGVSAARNKGINQVRFDYVAFLDADDYWESDFLFSIRTILDKYPQAGIMGSAYTRPSHLCPNYSSEIREIDDYFKIADYNTLFTSSSTVIRRDFFDQNQGFKEYLIKGEDLDVWFRAVSWFGKAYYIDRPLMYYDICASEGSVKIPNFNQTIFSEILSESYLPKSQISWAAFRDKYVLLNCWIFFGEFENRKKAIELLQKVKSGYSLARIPYELPEPFLEKISNSPRLRLWIRNYLKFCFRYIYT